MTGRRALVRAATAAAVSLCTAHALAAPTEEARKEAKTLFDQGVKQAEAGDAKAALASFRGAYAKAPSFRVLYNIGQLCSRTGDAACAVRSYRQYLDDGGASVPASRRQSVDAEIRSLSRTVATLRVQSSVEGGDVTVDDAPVGKTPVASPVLVNGGSHRVALVAREKTIEKSVVVLAGEVATVVLEPAKDEVATVAATEAPETKTDPRPTSRAEAPATKRDFPIVPWAVTGGLALATVVTGVFAANAYSSFKDKRGSFPVSREDLDSAQGSARDLFIVTSVLGVATVVSAGVAGYFTIASSGSSTVGVTAGPRGVAMVGAFR